MRIKEIRTLGLDMILSLQNVLSSKWLVSEPILFPQVCATTWNKLLNDIYSKKTTWTHLYCQKTQLPTNKGSHLHLSAITCGLQDAHIMMSKETAVLCPCHLVRKTPKGGGIKNMRLTPQRFILESKYSRWWAGFLDHQQDVYGAILFQKLGFWFGAFYFKCI